MLSGLNGYLLHNAGGTCPHNQFIQLLQAEFVHDPKLIHAGLLCCNSGFRRFGVGFDLLFLHFVLRSQFLRGELRFLQDQIRDESVFRQFLVRFVLEFRFVVFRLHAGLLRLLIQNFVLQRRSKIRQVGFGSF